MRKISELKGEDAIEVVADLIEPISEIFGDKEMQAAFKDKETDMKFVKMAIKKHKRAVVEILAIIEGAEDIDAYAETLNVFSLPKKVMEILNDKDLMSLFQLQG